MFVRKAKQEGDKKQTSTANYNKQNTNVSQKNQSNQKNDNAGYTFPGKKVEQVEGSQQKENNRPRIDSDNFPALPNTVS